MDRPPHDNARAFVGDEGVVLNCPGCGTQVADGEAICPKCDYIIDPNAFSAEPPEADEVKPAPARPSRPAAPAGKLRPTGVSTNHRTSTDSEVPRARPPPGRRPSGKSVAATPSSTAVKSLDEIEKARTKRPPPPRAPSRKGGAMPDAPSHGVREKPAAPSANWRTRPEDNLPGPIASPSTSGYQIAAPEEVLNDAKRFVTGLPSSDKLAFLGAALNILFAFFPWKETVVDGEVLGLMSLGFPVFAVSILAIVAIVVRVRRIMPKLNPLVPWLLQLSAVCFCIVWCLIFVKLSWDSRLAKSPVGNFDMYISKPSFGVFISVLTSILALGGTLMGLKEKPA